MVVFLGGKTYMYIYIYRIHNPNRYSHIIKKNQTKVLDMCVLLQNTHVQNNLTGG